MVGGRAVDLFRIDTRGSDCGHLADLSHRKRSHPTDTQRRLRAAGISGRPVPLLSRPSSGGPGERRYRQVDAPTSRWRTRGTGARGVRPFLWSVTDIGIVFVTREADFDAIDVYRFSDQRVARVGRLGFRIPGIYTHMTASRDGRWALATKMARFDSDLMRLDTFR